MTKSRPTLEEVAALLRYNPQTGEFSWRVDRHCGRGRLFAEAGSKAGGLDSSTGYERISINYAHCHAHRLAWLLTHGDWPTGDIDHINGNRADNRLANLRDVPHRMNLQNQRQASRRSASGIAGVSQVPSGRWRATIQAPDGKRHLGTFDTAADAEQVRIAAKRALHAGCTI